MTTLTLIDFNRVLVDRQQGDEKIKAAKETTIGLDTPLNALECERESEWVVDPSSIS